MSTTATELDPRIERTRRVVLDAATELIGECGFGRTSIEAISERSGVARSTIYRHWPERSELLLEAIGKHLPPMVTEETGDLRTDLTAKLSELARLLSTEPTGTVVASFIVEARRDPELSSMHRKFTKMRRSAAIGVIRRAIESGELPEDTDPKTMADDLAAPIFYKALVLRQPIDESWVQAHVDRWIGLHRRS